jgi:hypothetical protein
LFTEPDAEAFDPDFTRAGDFAWFVNEIPFDATDTLFRDDLVTLYTVNFVQQCFPCYCRTRLIPTFIGPQGSAKSTSVRRVGRLLVGPRFDVVGLRRDKEDAFIVGVTNQILFGVDNIDSRVPWLEDSLATYATGQRFVLRRLYTTNDAVRFDSRAWLFLTGRDPKFRRADVAERICPFWFATAG